MNPIILKDLSDDDWLMERQKGVTATDLPILLGMAYGDDTPSGLAMRKRADYPIQLEPNERMVLGLALEPHNAARYAQSTGKEVQRAPSLVIHPDRPWQMASLDYIQGDIKKPVELKAVFSHPSHPWGESGSDQVPDRFLVQTTQQAGIVGAEYIELSVLFVGFTHRIYRIPFDPELFKILTDVGGEFKAIIDSGEEIGPDWRSSYLTAVEAKVMKLREGLETDLDDFAENVSKEYLELGRIEKAAKERREIVKESLRHCMGEAAIGKLPGGGMVTRKTIKVRGRTQVIEPSEYERLTVKIPNQKAVENE